MKNIFSKLILDNLFMNLELKFCLNYFNFYNIFIFIKEIYDLVCEKINL